MKLGFTMLIYNKDDIEFVTEFPCILGHPVSSQAQKYTHCLEHPTNLTHEQVSGYFMNFKGIKMIDHILKIP